MKKAISILVLTVLLVSMMSVVTYAHGGHHGTRAIAYPQPQYELCAVDGCDSAGLHQHGEAWYRGQTATAGTYAICTVEGCALLGLHEHDGAYYHCANYDAGYAAGYGCGRVWMR